MHQATWALWPKWLNPGTPGIDNPSTSQPGQEMWPWTYTFGISSGRCGSPASSGSPEAVRLPASAQLLLPPSSRPAQAGTAPSHCSPGGTQASCGPARPDAIALAAAGPRVCATTARQSFAAADPIVRWRTRYTSRQCHGSQGSRRSEEHTSELQSRRDLVCRLLLEKKKK